MPSPFTQPEITRYARHLILPEVGLAGQRRLKQSSVLIVGTGGLGSPIALYLAAAGVGRIGLVDYDLVDESNLQRQVVHAASRLGQPKVHSARAHLLDLNPHIQVDAYHVRLTSANAAEIAAPYDLLVDGTDNFASRYLLNDLAVQSAKPYIYGSIFRFEGQVSVFDATRGPCYRCLFPTPPPPASVPSCADAGVMGVLPGTIGTLQATEAVKLILGIGEPMIGRLLLYDALDSTFQTIRLRKNPACPLCGAQPTITRLIDYDQFCGSPAAVLPDFDPRLEMQPSDLADLLRQTKAVQLVDVREPHELEISSLPGAVNIPLGVLAQSISTLDRAKEIVVFCRTGVRSLQAVQALHAAGFTQARSLRGGINAYAREINPSLFQY
jgi:adenylyltransferase/sulfurtransferase